VKRVERTARIGATPEALFEFVADIDNIGEWQTGVERVEKLTPGPMAAGSRARIVRTVMGQRVEAPLTIAEFEPPRRLAIESTVSGVKARGVLDLEPADDGAATDVRFAMEIRGSLITSFLEPMIANAAAADVDASLDRLRARFEGATA
jgi:carbon monoxide dehydrogenase subunit G